MYLGDELLRILKKRIEEDSFNTGFVFHDNGQPLGYRQIQYNYDWALEKAGLGDRFSGTHILRHSMATLTRQVTGSLNSTQAVTGHKDFKLVQHYAALDNEENKKAIMAVESHLLKNSFFDYEQIRAGVKKSHCFQWLNINLVLRRRRFSNCGHQNNNSIAGKLLF